MNHETKMRLRNNPFPIIFSHGDEVTRLICLDFFGLRHSQKAEACLLAIKKQQYTDGSYPSRFGSEHWGMQETVRNTLLYLHVGIPAKTDNIQRAIRFVLNHQCADGGWCENPLLKIPSEQIWLSNQRSVTWLTADIIELLRQVGMTKRYEYLAAMSWLRRIQNWDGSWPSLAQSEIGSHNAPGDPDATAQITFLMGELCGENAPTYLRGRMQFERYLDNCAQDIKRGYLTGMPAGEKDEIEVYHLTHRVGSREVMMSKIRG